MRHRNFRILAINPGSTSTKIAVFDNDSLLLEEGIPHTSAELERFPDMMDQGEHRQREVLRALTEREFPLQSLDAVVGRGGMLKPIPGGTYLINEAMLKDLRRAERGEHASNLGAVIAKDIADSLNLPSYIVDPVVVDEFPDIARLSGLPGYDRQSIYHALNQKAVARKIAKAMGKSYADVNLIVAHLGGGITVGAHRGGKVIDVNAGIYGEGPFTPDRTGGLPTWRMLELCYEKGYAPSEVKKLLAGKGGMVAYLGTNDAREVVRRIQAGDQEAKLVYEGMAYQIAKEIAANAAVLYGKVDGIILTGGMAHDQMLVDLISDRVRFLAEIRVFPGEDEMSALAEGALRVLQGEEIAQDYL